MNNTPIARSQFPNWLARRVVSLAVWFTLLGWAERSRAQGRFPPDGGRQPLSSSSLGPGGPGSAVHMGSASMQMGSGAQMGSGLVRLAVPKNRPVRWIDFRVEGAREERVENQLAPNSDSLVTIGRVREAEIDLKKDFEVEDQGLIDSQAIFYQYSGLIRLNRVELIPTFLRMGQEMRTEGRTPPFFTVAILDLEKVGDLEGEVIQRFDRVGFTLGEPNRFHVGKDILPGRAVGVRVGLAGSLQGGEFYLQIKASRAGKFPAHVIQSSHRVAEVAYHPAVRFFYEPDKSAAQVIRDPIQDLISQINAHLESQPAPGGIVEIPLRVKVGY